MTIGIREIYKHYKNNTKSKKPLTYNRFKEILYFFNERAVECMIERGSTLELYGGANRGSGSIFVRRVDRDYSKTYIIDFKRTKETGETCYYTDKDYVFFKWSSSIGKYSNFYQFKINKGQFSSPKHLHKKLIDYVRKYPEAKYRYSYGNPTYTISLLKDNVVVSVFKDKQEAEEAGFNYKSLFSFAGKKHKYKGFTIKIEENV
jgi:hypothetical protein